MGVLTVRNLDESVKRSLRLRAAQHGWPMEQQARVILQAAVSPTPGAGLDMTAACQRRPI